MHLSRAEGFKVYDMMANPLPDGRSSEELALRVGRVPRYIEFRGDVADFEQRLAGAPFPSRETTQPHREPTNERPRWEPRKKWPRKAVCAAPWAEVKGRRGARVELRLSLLEGRKHLPVVELTWAA